MIPARRVRSGMASLARRLRRDGCRPTLHWLRGHVWPCLTGVPLLRHSQVAPGLLVGAQIGRAGRRYLERLGVSASVNLRAEFDDRPGGLALARHLWLPTVDGEAPTLDQFAEGVAFLGEVLSSGSAAYVHCESGVGRAPTLAAAFLLGRGLGLDAALGLLRDVRPFIDPTPAQVERLRAFAAGTP